MAEICNILMITVLNGLLVETSPSQQPCHNAVLHRLLLIFETRKA